MKSDRYITTLKLDGWLIRQSNITGKISLWHDHDPYDSYVYHNFARGYNHCFQCKAVIPQEILGFIKLCEWEI